MIGPKTLTVVSVEAVMAACTSSAPTDAAWMGGAPSSSRCRKMFSSTTMELSTNIPTPSARPPRLMMLRLTPAASMSAKVPTTEIGIASAIATG